MINKTILTGIRPTGRLHLGHYLGIIKPALLLQEDNILKFGIMDLHQIDLKEQEEGFVSDFTKKIQHLGIDNIFIQSKNAGSLFWELFWNFSKIANNGELQRMTQFKDKKDSNPSLALLSYPVLMATDIATANCEYVLIGQDQKQHLELARNLIIKANKIFGFAGIEPQPLILETVSKIMSLQNPNKKMSKSDNNELGCIFLDDNAETIEKKIKKAVTTPEGIINLQNINNALGGKELDFTQAASAKKQLVDLIISKLN